MWVWVDRLGALVLDATLAAAALTSLAALAMLGCRQPARRIGLARGALLGVLALLPLVGLALVPRLDLVGAWRDSGPRSHPLLASGEALASILPLSRLGAGQGQGPARALTLLYLAGVGFSLSGLMLGYWGLGWLARSTVEPSAATRALYQSLPFRGPGRRPRLRVATRARNGIGRPVLLGLFRPLVLIPSSLETAEAAGPLRLSLLHELAHAEGGDPWFSLAGRLAQAFWFFLPPLWWILAQMRLDQEFLADRCAVSGFGLPPDYASSLLGLAASGSETAPTAGSGASTSALFLRVLMLVRCPFAIERRPPAWWSGSLAALVAVLTLAASTLSVRVSPRMTGTAVADTPAPGSRSFRMARLQIDPQPANSHGRAPLFELPIRLPERFDLAVEVWGDRETIAGCRVAGLRLGLIPTGTEDDPGLPAWHTLRVRREGNEPALWLDDRRLALEARPAVTTTWLSVEPRPETRVAFRNLRMTW